MFVQEFAFSLVVFFTCRFLTFFLVLISFKLNFLEVVFQIQSQSILGLLVCFVNENSLNRTSGLVLLYFFLFQRQDFFFDRMTSSSIHICFLFIHSCNFNWIACVASFFTLIWARNWNWIFLTLIQRDKVKWMRVDLMEGYLRAANKSSKNYTDP